MKDSYTCDLDEAGLDVAYEKHYEAYTRIFERLGLRAIAVASDVGMMGGSGAHEFMVLNEYGEDVLVLCETCGFSANRQVAKVRVSEPPTGEPLPLEEVATPGHDDDRRPRRVPRDQPRGDGEGDLLRGRRRAAHHRHRPRRHGGQRDEARQRHRRPGAPAGPGRGDQGRRHGARLRLADRRAGAFILVDELVARSSNLVAGANREGFHYRNVNVGRDFTPDLVADLANAREGDGCPTCGAPVILRNGIEVGNIFKLGTKYTTRPRRHVPRRGRDGASHRHGLLRDRRRARRSPASSRPTTTPRGSPGRRRWRPTPPTS